MIDTQVLPFRTTKAIVAMAHLPGLPGRPRHDLGSSVDAMVDWVGRDVRALQNAGVDGLLFCNEADLPYQLRVGPEIPAAMAAIVGQLKADIRVPFGVDIVWDPIATLACARATGAAFVREVFAGVYESDLGLMQPDFGSIAAYQAAIGASGVKLFSNITPEFASSIGTRPLAARAESAAYLGVDVILVSGPITGQPADLVELHDVKQAVPTMPVFANTGIRAETVAEVLAVADGAIVGTSLKVGGITWNAVDPDRARRFMDIVGGLPGRTGVSS